MLEDEPNKPNIYNAMKIRVCKYAKLTWIAPQGSHDIS